ncbi:MAG: HAD family hydrolase [Bdellovibrionota bacterium]
MKRVIVFDLDGTLISTMEGFADIAADLIHKTFSTPLEKARQDYIDTSGIAFCNQLEVLFPNHEKNKSVSDEFERRKMIHFFDEKPHPKVIESLLQLKNNGLKLAISSNNYHHVVNEYADRHFEDLFDLALGYEKDFAKGDPHFGKICDVLRTNNDEMIFVADSLSDLRLAKKCNVEFIGVEGIFSTQDFRNIDQEVRVLKQLWDLPEYLQN